MTKAFSRATQDNNYSFTEADTGAKWHDGRAIYKKSVNCGAAPNATNKIVAHGCGTVAFIWAEGVAISNTDPRTIIPLSYVDTATLSGSMSFYTAGTDIVLRAGGDRTAYNVIITLYYCK